MLLLPSRWEARTLGGHPDQSTGLGLRPSCSSQQGGSQAEGEEWAEIPVGSFLRVRRVKKYAGNRADPLRSLIQLLLSAALGCIERNHLGLWHRPSHPWNAKKHCSGRRPPGAIWPWDDNKTERRPLVTQGWAVC